MTSKQRAALKAKANGCEAVFQIGKGGVSDTLAAAVLRRAGRTGARQTVGIKDLRRNARAGASDTGGQTECRTVCAIGNKIVLYRFSPNKTEHIEL